MPFHAIVQNSMENISGFACLSFTNKACGELMEKYKNMHNETLKYPNLVATIDSFITQNVVLPFWYLCDYCKTKPIIINDKAYWQKSIITE